MKHPRMIIDLEKIEANARVAVEEAAKHGVNVIGVTKACLGAPEVARAMLAGGVSGLADSRLPNLKRLRSAGVDGPMTLLRLPMLSEAAAVVGLADVSLNTSAAVVKRLGQEAAARGRRHGVVIMVETGDEREGVSPSDVAELAELAETAPGIDLLGVGTNVACLTGCAPSALNLGILSQVARTAAAAVGRPLRVVSGGNSSAWQLMQAGRLPEEITELRLGEAILLGRETAGGTGIGRMRQDAFLIEAEIIESLPERGGHHIAALGLQDTAVNDLVPLDAGWAVVKGSSDHLVLRRDGVPAPVGSTVVFQPGYASLLRAMTSPFVLKEYV